MTTRFTRAICGALLLAGAATLAARTEVARIERNDERPVVFVCLNGVAMSVWSAAYFNRLAAARGLPERAIARASIPSYTAVPLSMKLGLAIDGFRVGDFRPLVMDEEDARSAALVVAIDTELPERARSIATTSAALRASSSSITSGMDEEDARSAALVVAIDTEVPERARSSATTGAALRASSSSITSGMDEEDARSAALVVAIDTELPERARSTHSVVERWNGFPPMREQYFPSRAALKMRVERLVERLAATHQP